MAMINVFLKGHETLNLEGNVVPGPGGNPSYAVLSPWQRGRSKSFSAGMD